MSKKSFIFSSLAIFLASTFSANANEFSASQELEIQKIIEKTLTEKPEIVQQALVSLEMKQEQQQQERQQKAIKENFEQIYNDPNSPTIGNNEAKLKVVYFTDYNCAYCRRFEPSIEKVQKDFSNDVLIIFKPLAFLGKGSQLSAEYILSSWEITPKDFSKKHSELMNKKTPNDEKTINSLVEKEKVIVSEKAKDTLKNNMALAQKLGIQGTPTTIIGDIVIPGLIDYEMLENIIRNKLDTKK